MQSRLGLVRAQTALAVDAALLFAPVAVSGPGSVPAVVLGVYQMLRLLAAEGMVALGNLSLDNTKLAGNAAKAANRRLPQTEKILAEAAETDDAELGAQAQQEGLSPSGLKGGRTGRPSETVAGSVSEAHAAGPGDRPTAPCWQPECPRRSPLERHRQVNRRRKWPADDRHQQHTARHVPHRDHPPRRAS